MRLKKVYYESDSHGNKTEYIPISDFANPNLSLYKIKKGCLTQVHLCIGLQLKIVCNHNCSNSLDISSKF